MGGAPIENAYAPYPTSALSKEDLLASNVAAGKAETLDAAWTDLEALVGTGTYAVWVYNEETGDLKSPSGDFYALDSAGDTAAQATGTSSFNSNSDWTNFFSTSDAVGDYTHIFLSVEDGVASAPSATQPLWAQYTDMNGDPSDPFLWSFTESGAMSFGTFNTGLSEEWAPNGRGEGGFWGTECNASDTPPFPCQGPTNYLDVVYRNLQLPPVGYYYEAWLVDDAGGEHLAGALLAKQTDPNTMPGSLFEIDTDQALQDQWSDGVLIIWSETITTLGDIEPSEFYDMLEYRLQLKPKGADPNEMGGTTVLGGFTPEPMRDRKPDPEPG